MTMTNSTPSPRPKKAGASRNSKVISTGLAVATGLGVSGMVAVRMAQDVSAQSPQVDPASISLATSTATSTAGYTQAQLDSYAQALTTEAERLREYRNQLVQVAESLQSNAAPAQSQSQSQSASTSTSKSATASVQKPESNPKPKQKPKDVAPAKSAPQAPSSQPAQTAQTAPAAPAAQPAPAAAAAPQIQAKQPAPQAAAPQSQSKSS
jgi:hypothetical protein